MGAEVRAGFARRCAVWLLRFEGWGVNPTGQKVLSICGGPLRR